MMMWVAIPIAIDNLYYKRTGAIDFDDEPVFASSNAPLPRYTVSVSGSITGFSVTASSGVTRYLPRVNAAERRKCKACIFQRCGL